MTRTQTQILAFAGPLTLAVIFLRVEMWVAAYCVMGCIGMTLAGVEAVKLFDVKRARERILDDQFVNSLYVGWGIAAAVCMDCLAEAILLVIVLPAVLPKYSKNWALVVDAALSIAIILWMLAKPFTP